MKTLIKPICYSDAFTDLCFRTMPNYLHFLKRKDDMLIFKFVSFDHFTHFIPPTPTSGNHWSIHCIYEISCFFFFFFRFHILGRPCDTYFSVWFISISVIPSRAIQGATNSTLCYCWILSHGVCVCVFVFNWPLNNMDWWTGIAKVNLHVEFFKKYVL